MSSSESIEVNLLDFVKHSFSCYHSADRETVSDTFGHSDDIRFDSLPSVTPKLRSNSSETSLHLIADYQSSVFVSDKLNQFRQITLRERVDASNSLDAFEDDSCQFSIGS